MSRNDMKTGYDKIGKGLLKGCAVTMLVFAMTACNDTIEDSLKYDYPESGSHYKSNHVMLVVMDGAAGKSVQTVRNANMAPNLKAMISHAMYTDAGLGDGTLRIREEEDEQLTNGRGWANLMVGNTTHGIKSDEELESKGFMENFASRLADSGAAVSMYAANDVFRQTFASEKINAPEDVNTDMEVKERVLEELQLSVVPDLIVAQFKGVVEAAGGVDGTYYTDYTETAEPANSVKEAIRTLDGYIGEIWDALKSRPNYAAENWMIVVTSNYGGYWVYETEERPDTHYKDRTRNTFTMMYNVNLMPEVQVAPGDMDLSYSYNTPMYAYDYKVDNPTTYVKSARLGNTETGELRFDEEGKIVPITIQFFLKSSVSQDNRKYVILSKSANMDENSKIGSGWFFHFNVDNSGRRICFGSGGKRWLLQTQNEDKLNLDWAQWHVLTVTLAPHPDKSGRTQIVFYLDGEENNKTDYSNSDMKKYNAQNSSYPSTTAPLRIGETEDAESQKTQRNTKNVSFKNYFYVSNLQLYDKALTAEEVKSSAGIPNLHKLGEDFILWEHLVGYWPCDLEDEMMGKVMKNYAKGALDDESDDFIIDRGSYGAWTSGNEQSPALHPSPDADPSYYSKTFNTVDISRQIFLWLGKFVRWDWNMEGKAWEFTYKNFSNENN